MQTRDPAASSAVFSGVNVRSVVNRHISALRMCCSSTSCVEKKWIFPLVIVRKLSKKFTQEKLRLCSSSASGPSLLKLPLPKYFY